MTANILKGAFAALVTLSITGAANAQSVVDVINNDASLGRFSEIVQRSGIAPQLSSTGPFTVFAPTDQAFEQLPYTTRRTLAAASPPELQKFVLRYVSSYGRQLYYAGGDTERRLQALDGSPLVLERMGSMTGENQDLGPLATLNGTRFRDNLQATNGWVHYLDGVLPTQ